MTSRQNPPPRRRFLAVFGAAALTGACGSASPVRASSSGDEGGAPGAGGSGGETIGAGGNGGAGGGEALSCTPSPDNILGPYYREGAPFRTDLTELGMDGTRITVSGRVMSTACEPIAGALIDLWQADADGGYDNDGVDDPPADSFVLRGRMTADGDGAFSFRTIIPGHYKNGAQYRPAHLHVTVSAPGYTSLTTQLYFEGDPYNDIDPFYLSALELALADDGDAKVAAFDFVLASA